MPKYLIFLIIFIVIIIVSFIIYFFFIKKSSTNISQEEQQSQQEEKNKPVNALCQGGEAGTSKSDPISSNKEENYTFSTVAKLGRDILKQIIKFLIIVKNRIFLKSEIENYALSQGNTNDINILDPNKYYQIGSLTKSNTITSAKFGGETCKEFSPNIYKLILPINASCKSSDIDLYDFPLDSRSICNISKIDGSYKLGTRKSDTDITINKQLYGGLSCSSQISQTKDIKCGSINAVCKTSDLDLYDIPPDSKDVCSIYNEIENRYYKQATRKTNDTVLTSLPAINGGLTCSSQIPLTKNILCGPLNAVCKDTDAELYDIPDDSHTVCSISRSDGWYKNSVLKPESSIQLTSSINGGLTCTQQYPSSKIIKCGPIDAICSIDNDILYPNPPIDSTDICRFGTKRTDISSNPRITSTSITYYMKRQKQSPLNTSDSAITITPQKNSGLTCSQKTPNPGYVDCSSAYYYTIVRNMY